MPAGSSAAVRARYAELRAAGVASIRKGDYPAALRDFQAAFELASTSGRVQLRHEAQANLAMTYIQLGQDRTAEQGLRQILLETPGARLRFGAAYNLAVSLRKQGRYSRARFYARQAMESARRLGDASRRAACHNLLGNILMNQSFLSEALFEYRQALAIRRRQRRDVRFSTAIVLENIGYTYLLLRKFRKGAGVIRSALELATAIGDQRCIAESNQDLCYASMLMGRLDEAALHGERALEMATAHGYHDIEKNCYYLLGESAHLAGRTAERDRHFDRLQRLHPELPFLREFLCAFDLSRILTLKR